MLDNIKQIQKLDKSNMADFILQMPEQIEESLTKIEKLEISADWTEVKNICLCGMGGSAVANHLVANLPQEQRKLQTQIIRNYDIPAWVDENTLVILTSHSGKTAETLSAFKKAVEKKANIFIIAETGQLEKMGEKVGALVFDYDTKAVPRASLGYQLGAIFGLLKKLKIIDYDLQPAIELLKKINTDYNLEREKDKNLAKKLAYACIDRLPIVVGSGILQSVTWRWKTQFNENAKNICYTEFLPEAMHNAIEGFALPKRFTDDSVLIILKNSFDNPELQMQFKRLEKVLEEQNIRYEIVDALGDDVFSQKLSTLILGDWVSYYLAILNGVDPTPVNIIKNSKK